MNPTALLLIPEVQELIAGKQFVELREALHGLQSADVADILAEIPAEEAAIAFRILPHDDAGRVFSYLPPEKQEDLIRALGTSGDSGVITFVTAEVFGIWILHSETGHVALSWHCCNATRGRRAPARLERRQTAAFEVTRKVESPNRSNHRRCRVHRGSRQA